MKVYNITDPSQYRGLTANANIKVLWLDDLRIPKHWFQPETLNMLDIDIAKNYHEFAEFIEDGKYANYDMICLDHDLGWESDAPTGYDCVMALDEEHMEWGLPCPDVFIHTSNPVGRQRMLKVLDKIKAREIQKSL